MENISGINRSRVSSAYSQTGALCLLLGLEFLFGHVILCDLG